VNAPPFVRFKALAGSLAERCRRVPLEVSTKRRPQVLALTTLLWAAAPGAQVEQEQPTAEDRKSVV
jgi:hypothetical protein